MLENAQGDLGNSIHFSDLRLNYIWNSSQNSALNVENDPDGFEFATN